MSDRHINKLSIFSILFLAMVAIYIFMGLRTVNAATVENKGNCSIYLNGEIDNFTADAIAKRYSQIKNCSGVGVTLYVNSNGGNVDTAIKAGDFIRQNRIRTFVDVNDSCASACVLLFLGGVNRSPVGRMGLHRPYSLNLSSSELESRRSYETINNQIRQYLIRMNIPDGILNAMNAVPPNKIKWLQAKYVDDDDYKQLVSYHIIGSDPVFDDQRDSALAKRLGISKQEYYAREQRAESICPDPLSDPSRGSLHERFEQYGKCHEDVLNGRR